MLLLGFLLDGDPFRDWRLFPWSIYFPVLTIAISWVLIRWNRKLVVVALGMAAAAAILLLDQLYGDLRFRDKVKADIIQGMNWKEMEAVKTDPKLTPEERKAFYVSKSKIEVPDFAMYGGIPPYNQSTIRAVWFAALFPFVPIIAFYLSAKAQKSPRAAPKQT